MSPPHRAKLEVGGPATAGAVSFQLGVRPCDVAAPVVVVGAGARRLGTAPAERDEIAGGPCLAVSSGERLKRAFRAQAG